MIRRLFTAASVLSLLMCVASLGLWVRSQSRSDEAFRASGNDNWMLVSYHGAIYFRHVRWNWVRPVIPSGTKVWWGKSQLGLREAEMVDYRPCLYRAGQDTLYGVTLDGSWDGPTTRVNGIFFEGRVPLLAVAMICFVAPAVGFAEYTRRRKRTAEGRCLTCGYDLRASTDRCPECGTPIPATS
ncbi:MAG TPA: hypothetical protein VGI81_17575 [Tepidisphaeraceae bacterium]|jgi:hypothetical protein